MVIKNIRGRQVKKNFFKHKMNWSKKSRSKIQFDLKNLLMPYWKYDEVYEEFPVVGTKLSIDIVNVTKKIAIEVQGRQHTEYVPHFHPNGKMDFFSQLERDNKKLDFCEINGWRMIEIFEKEFPISLDFLEKHDIL